MAGNGHGPHSKGQRFRRVARYFTKPPRALRLFTFYISDMRYYNGALMREQCFARYHATMRHSPQESLAGCRRHTKKELFQSAIDAGHLHKYFTILAAY